MDNIKRLARLAHAWLNESSSEQRNDPEWNAAWEELSDWLDIERTFRRHNGPASRRKRSAPISEALRRDYEAIEAPSDADVETLRKAYLSVVRRYHPDKWSHDPRAHRTATEITRRLNAAWARIRTYHSSH